MASGQSKNNVSKLLEELVAQDNFEVKAKNPNSYENKILAIISAFLTHKALAEKIAAKALTLLLTIESLFKLSNKPSYSHSTSVASESEEQEKSEKIMQSKKTEKSTADIMQEIASLREQQYTLHNEYAASMKNLRENTINQINEKIQNILNTNDPVFNEKATNSIVQIYEQRAQEKPETMEAIKSKFLPTLKMEGHGTKQADEEAKVTDTMSKKYDVNTSIQMVGALKNLASEYGVTINNKMALAAINDIDKLMKVTQLLTSAIQKEMQTADGKINTHLDRLEKLQDLVKNAQERLPTNQTQVGHSENKSGFGWPATMFAQPQYNQKQKPEEEQQSSVTSITSMGKK